MVNSNNIVFSILITGDKEKLAEFAKWFEETGEQNFNLENYIRDNNLEEFYTTTKSYTKIMYRFFSKNNFCSNIEWALFKQEFKTKWGDILSLDIIHGYETIIVSKQVEPQIAKTDSPIANFLVEPQYIINFPINK